VEHARLVEGPEGGGSRPPRILLVEDDLTIRQMTQLALERDGFAVSSAHDGASGLAAFRAEPPDLVILDVMLPGVDGVSVCRTIRERSVVPIVMLTARTDPVDVVVGLEAGADDYVTKPFEPSILAARLRAVLRRVARHDASPVLRVGEVEIDRQGMEVRVGSELVSLTPTEYRLLLELAEHSGAVLSRERLLEDAGIAQALPVFGLDPGLVEGLAHDLAEDVALGEALGADIQRWRGERNHGAGQRDETGHHLQAVVHGHKCALTWQTDGGSGRFSLRPTHFNGKGRHAI